VNIYLYSISCEGCSGNHALSKIQQACKQQDVDFQERRTIFWDRWEKEADEIMKLNPGLELPFYYFEETGDTLPGSSLLLLDTIERWVKKNKELYASQKSQT